MTQPFGVYSPGLTSTYPNWTFAGISMDAHGKKNHALNEPTGPWLPWQSAKLPGGSQFIDRSY